ncbi:TetR/AcrR family transcriptional regulator [Nocardia pseudobrasiliensis]|nr:TetR/AcrR family transcriptional regulator [Nocardia pseudobrasiliensis]
MGEAPKGRPRDPAIEEAIMRATSRRLATDGYSRMRVADIAADAGVTRPTIYLRWPTKRELVEAVMDYRFQQQATAPTAPDLDELHGPDALKAALTRFASAEAIAVATQMWADSAQHPDVWQSYREHALTPRLDFVNDTLRRLRERGEIAPEVDIEAAAAACLGVAASLILLSEKATEEAIDQAIDLLWWGLRPRP